MTAEAKTKGDAGDMKEKKRVGLFEWFTGHLPTYLAPVELAKFKESIKTDAAQDAAATAVIEKAQTFYKGARSQWLGAYQLANAVQRRHCARIAEHARIHIQRRIARPLIVIV